MPRQDHAADETDHSGSAVLPYISTLSLILSLIMSQLLSEPDQPVDLAEGSAVFLKD